MMTPDANDELTAVYRELRVIARGLLNREPYAHTLESCELVNLAWARILDTELRARSEEDPRKVIALAVMNMRRVLVDHARKRRAAKRPTSAIRISFEDAPLQAKRDPDTFLEVDRLLDELAAGPDRVRNGERKAEVARYALYGGLTEAEIAAALDLPKSTVGNDLRFARAWLTTRLGADAA
jgi:RNA polymerase sigma factor (TIGR02999 family)